MSVSVFFGIKCVTNTLHSSSGVTISNCSLRNMGSGLTVNPDLHSSQPQGTVTIHGTGFTNCGTGLQLNNVITTIGNSTITGNGTGLFLTHSVNQQCTLTNVRITNNSFHGLLSDGSGKNPISCFGQTVVCDNGDDSSDDQDCPELPPSCNCSQSCSED